MTQTTNLQPPELLDHDAEKIQLHSAWHTIQGEGPHAGTPAVFVRLSGCNIQCPSCDTEYTSKRILKSPAQILKVVRGIRRSGLVVLTGGEPFRQNIVGLVHALLDARYLVQIETNGTIFRALPFHNMNLSIVCSPKTAEIHQQLEPHIEAVKYVIQSDYIAEDGLPSRTLGNRQPVARLSKGHGAEIYVQPLDEGHPSPNAGNLEAALGSCLAFGYRLCIQLHKVLNLK